jgi:hypothetical protein
MNYCIVIGTELSVLQHGHNALGNPFWKSIGLNLLLKEQEHLPQTILTFGDLPHNVDIDIFHIS